MRFPILRSPVALLLCTAASIVALIASAGRAEDKYPEPSPYQISWQFKFQHGTPKRIVVDVPGNPNPTAYWYMSYTVSNSGDKAQDFVPQFLLLSNDGKVTRSDIAIPAEVFRDIKRQEGNKLLLDHHKVSGPLNPGEDEARDSVAIWPEPMRRMGTFSIFVGGLSGEFLPFKDGVILRKTLQLTYHQAGDQVLPGPDDDHPQVEQWIMR